MIGKRLLQGVIVLLLLSALIFGLFSVLGSDTLTIQENNPQISPEIIKQWRKLYGLDKSLPERYGTWLGNVAHGDLGLSIHHNRPVSDIIWPALLRTSTMAIVASCMALIIALSFGIAAARNDGSWIDSLSNGIILLGSSTPRLIVALITLALVSRVTWYDVTGNTTFETLGQWVMQVAPPAFALSWPLTALFLSQARVTIGESLRSEYVRTARAKGVSESVIMFRHVIRPALAPMITVVGYSLGSIISGSVIVETVLRWPGIGEISVSAVKYRDIPLLMGILIVTVTAIILGNLLSDILMYLNDPRLRDSFVTQRGKEARNVKGWKFGIGTSDKKYE